MAQKICSDCKFYVPFEGESCGKCTAPVYCEAYERANER